MCPEEEEQNGSTPPKQQKKAPVRAKPKDKPKR